VLDHDCNFHGLQGSWRQHGLWAQVQLAAYQLLLEPQNSIHEMWCLLEKEKRTAVFYQAQAQNRYACQWLVAPHVSAQLVGGLLVKPK
jgi:hypothetical protein